MVIDTATALWFLPFLIPITIWVAWSDMSRMKIPNLAVGATFLVFVVVGLFALPFTEYLMRYLHIAVVLAIAFALWSLRVMGAGDAKFLAVMAPFIYRADWYPFMYILGATIIAAFIVHRTIKATPIRQMVPHWESWERRDFPMGMALAPALSFYLLIPVITG